MKGVRVAVLSLFLAFLATSVSAQTSRHEISIAAGASQFDASGTGTAPLLAIRVSGPIASSWLLGDLGLSYASLDEQFTTVNTRTGVAEGQVQAQWPANRFRPYIGIGGGWLHYFNNDGGRGATAQTASGSLGLRVAASSTLLLRGEMRLRTWNARDSGFHNSAAEFTGGVGFAF
jgi:hypothetical protein